MDTGDSSHFANFTNLRKASTAGDQNIDINDSSEKTPVGPKETLGSGPAAAQSGAGASWASAEKRKEPGPAGRKARRKEGRLLSDDSRGGLLKLLKAAEAAAAAAPDSSRAQQLTDYVQGVGGHAVGSREEEATAYLAPFDANKAAVLN